MSRAPIFRSQLCDKTSKSVPVGYNGTDRTKREKSNRQGNATLTDPGLEVIKLELILRLKIKHNDWLLADTCPQAANHCALF